jgi:glucan biosynthesis protein C
LTGLAFTILLIISGLAIGLYESGALKVVEHVPAVMKNVGSIGFALEYAPYFTVGAILNRTPNINATFNKVSAGVITVGLLAGISAVILRDHIALPVIRCLAAVTALAITQTIVAASSKLFDEERRSVRRAVDASFVIYLFHLPIIIAALWVVDALPVHFILQFGLLCAIALGGSLAVWSVVKRYPVAQFWLNGIPPTMRT